jgi:hypothetical protein
MVTFVLRCRTIAAFVEAVRSAVARQQDYEASDKLRRCRMWRHNDVSVIVKSPLNLNVTFANAMCPLEKVFIVSR